MTHKQHPIGTGFAAASTATDVLRGIDLAGENVIVTGGHAGLGLETTRTLAAAGASVTVAARDTERASRAVAGIARVEVSQLDLADPRPSMPSWPAGLRRDVRSTSSSTTPRPRRRRRSPGTRVATKCNFRPAISVTSSSPSTSSPPCGRRAARASSTSPRGRTVSVRSGGTTRASRPGTTPARRMADNIPANAASSSIDPQSAERLWELSERLLGDAPSRAR
jgi:hypothetical protein